MATIDERLEALTHTVELIAGMQMKNEEQLNTLAQTMDKLAKAHTEHQDAIARLALIAGNHEDRLSDLEGEGS